MEPNIGERKVVHLGPMECEMLMRPPSHKMLEVWIHSGENSGQMQWPGSHGHRGDGGVVQGSRCRIGRQSEGKAPWAIRMQAAKEQVGFSLDAWNGDGDWVLKEVHWKPGECDVTEAKGFGRGGWQLERVNGKKTEETSVILSTIKINKFSKKKPRGCCEGNLATNIKSKKKTLKTSPWWVSWGAFQWSRWGKERIAVSSGVEGLTG